MDYILWKAFITDRISHRKNFDGYMGTVRNVLLLFSFLSKVFAFLTGLSFLLGPSGFLASGSPRWGLQSGV